MLVGRYTFLYLWLAFVLPIVIVTAVIIVKLDPSWDWETINFLWPRILFFLPVFFAAVRYWVYTSIKDLSEAFRIKKIGVSTTGRVKSITVFEDSESKSYRTLIEFTATNGMVYEFTPRYNRHHPPVVGEKVNVLYDENVPERCLEDCSETFSGRMIAVIVAVFITLVLLLAVLQEIFHCW